MDSLTLSSRPLPSNTLPLRREPAPGIAPTPQVLDSFMASPKDKGMEQAARLRMMALRSGANANGSGAILAAPTSPVAVAPKAKPNAPLFADNTRWTALQGAAEGLEQLKRGAHPELKAREAAIEEGLRDEMGKLASGRKEALADLREQQSQLQARRVLLERQSKDGYKVEREAALAHHRQAGRGFDELRQAGHGELADSLGNLLLQEKPLVKGELDEASRTSREAFKTAQVRRLQERYGVEFPDEARLARMRKEGPPKGNSPQEMLDRTVFHRHEGWALDTQVPAEEQRRARYEAASAELSKRVGELSGREQRIETTYRQTSSALRQQADGRKRDARSELESRLRGQVADNSFRKAELSEAVRTSPAMAGVPQDSQARLVDGKLVYRDKDGREVSVNTNGDSVSVRTTDRDSLVLATTRSSLVTPAGRRDETVVFDYNGKVRRQEVTDLDRAGNGSRDTTEINSASRERVSEKLEAGKVASRTRRVDDAAGKVSTATSTFTYGDDGSRQESFLVEKRDGAKTSGVSRTDKDGTLLTFASIASEPLAGGKRTVTTTMEDRVWRATEHQKVELEGKTVETTVKKEGDKTVSSVTETTSRPRVASKAEKDLPGLGWVPWSTPEDLMTKLEAGSTVEIQTVERQIIGADGKSHQENVTKFLDRDRELILTRGPGGKNIWTDRKKVGADKWDSEVFFQGSSHDKIKTTNTVDGRFQVETTTLRMADHPGAPHGQVPTSGDYEIRKTRDGRVEDIAALASKLGIKESNLADSGAYKAFNEMLKKHPEARLEIEMKTAADTFAEPFRSDKDSQTGSLMVTGPEGLRLVLSRDSKKDRGGARVEWTQDGKRASHDSVFVGTERFEEQGTGSQLPAEIRALLSGGQAGPPKTAAPAQLGMMRGAANVGKLDDALTGTDKVLSSKAFRWMGAGGKVPRLDAGVARSLTAVSTGLNATATLADMARGEYGEALKHGGSAMRDLGSAARGIEKAAGGAKGLGTGGVGVMKKLGLAGAAVGLVSGAGRMLDGDAVGGGLDLGGALFSGMAIYGIPGVGWVAGLAAAGSMVWDYRNDTVIARPTL